MRNGAAADAMKTVALAAALGVPLTIFVASISMGLAHGGQFAQFILFTVVPGFMLGESGWLAVVAAQSVYYVVVAVFLRKVMVPCGVRRARALHQWLSTH
jgi:hypothetical protein